MVAWTNVEFEAWTLERLCHVLEQGKLLGTPEVH